MTMQPAKRIIPPAIFILLAGAALLWSALNSSDQQGDKHPVPVLNTRQPENRPIEVHSDGFAGSDSCQECHQHSYQTWHASYHRTMTQVANSESVVGPFDNVRLKFRETEYRLQRQGDQFSVGKTTTGPDRSEDVQRSVVMTTGSHHFQNYWMASGQSRALMLFPFTFWIDQQRWIPTQTQFLLPEFESELTPPAGLWNRDCQICHATQVRPRIVNARHMDTDLTEFGISCEECHGPAQKHVEHARLGLDDLAIVQPAGLSPAHSAAVCGQCHTRHDIPTDTWEHWKWHGDPFRPGDDLKHHRQIVESDDTIFWPDGLVRASGREYSGLILTPCYTHDDPSRQMTCLSCHNMHQQPDDLRPVKAWANDQLKPAMDSNTPGVHNNVACTQCHQKYADSQELTAHTRHGPSSSGSMCYNCHMPHTTWGLMKASRSHVVTSPNVQESLPPTGRLNACNLCHLDKTLDWTAQRLQERYGHEVPRLTPDQQTIAGSILSALTGDGAQRAFACWNMGWEPARTVSGDDWMPPILARLLVDPYPAVRGTARLSLQTIHGFDQIVYDHVGPVPQREAAQLQALEIWNTQSRAQNGDSLDHLLLDSRGDLREEELNRLWDQRDDRPVSISE